MTCKLYIKGNNKNYLPALRRFLKYVLITDSSILEKKSVLDKSTVLIDEDSPIDKDWLDFFNKHSNAKIVILGLSRKSNEGYVNLLDLSHLKANFQNVLNSKETGMSPLLLLRNIEQKINSLFKPHGEKSLYDLLNKTRQAILSGTDLLKKGGLNREDYKESYLSPGLENWRAFKKRLRKYEIYLKVCGFKDETAKINQNIRNFQRYIYKLININEDQIKKMSETEIKLSKDYLEEIDNNLNEMKRRIDSIYESL